MAKEGHLHTYNVLFQSDSQAMSQPERRVFSVAPKPAEAGFACSDATPSQALQ